MLLYLLNTVSYTVMMLPSMIEEETSFQNSKDFLKMKKKASKDRVMDVIYQTMRSGKRLPMFALDHRIQPLKLEKADASA